MPQWTNGFRCVVYDTLLSLGKYSFSAFVLRSFPLQFQSQMNHVVLISSFFMVVIAKDTYIQTVYDLFVALFQGTAYTQSLSSKSKKKK